MCTQAGAICQEERVGFLVALEVWTFLCALSSDSLKQRGEFRDVAKHDIKPPSENETLKHRLKDALRLASTVFLTFVFCFCRGIFPLIQPWYLAAQKHENTALKKAPRE
jgi:hypothetical protein